MATTRQCAECGTPLADDVPEGACPVCALRGALEVPKDTIQVAITEKPGDRIGRYKLLEQIGEGGCGVVYVAEQEQPVRRRVALKVIKLGMDTKQVIARFEAERQALALMDHPNIAKVLDGGATEIGRPFFVMELVKGVRITDYCDKNNLSTTERLGLFIQVCHAIQHAHQKGHDCFVSLLLSFCRSGSHLFFSPNCETCGCAHGRTCLDSLRLYCGCKVLQVRRGVAQESHASFLARIGRRAILGRAARDFALSRPSSQTEAREGGTPGDRHAQRKAR